MQENISYTETTTAQGKTTRKRILQAVINYIEIHGYPPTTREICELTGYTSTSTVNNHISRMVEEGMLETDAAIGSARALRVPGYRFVKE